jgi:hypothetical protein
LNSVTSCTKSPDVKGVRLVEKKFLPVPNVFINWFLLEEKAMPVDQATLIQSVYDSIFSQFVKPSSTSPVQNRGFLLNLEFPGQQLDESQYQNPWSPKAPDGLQFATEMLSALVNSVPLVDAIYVDSGVTVEEIYEFALGAVANPLPIPPNEEAPPNPVNTVIRNAQKTFEQTKMASALNPTLSYHPSYAIPSNWADPVAAQGWTSININSNNIIVKPDSLFSQMGGQEKLREGIWKIPSELLSAKTEKPDVVPTPLEITPSILEQIKSKVRQPRSSGALALGKDFSVDSEISGSRTSKIVNLQRLNPNPFLISRVNPKLFDEVKLTELANQPIDKSTTNIQISFRCCRVSFNRPWFMKSLLETKGWSLPGQVAGSLSSGTLLNNEGSFPLLPISFIAVRDLRIRAEWGEVDRGIAEHATDSGNTIGFGPFALSGYYAESGKSYASSFDGITITSPGLQILGWISLIIPYSPPS